MIKASLFLIQALFNLYLYVVILRFTEPLLRPIRRFIPTVAGFDFSPLIALILLQLLGILVLDPLMGFSSRLL